MAEAHRILLVDGDIEHLEQLRRVLAAEGYQAFTVTGVAEAGALLKRCTMELVIYDLAASPDDGLGFVGYISDNHDYTAVIVMSENPSVDEAVATIKTGADAHLQKPVPPEALLGAIRESLQKIDRRRRLNSGPVGGGGLQWDFVGESSAMLTVYGQIPLIGCSNAPVLIHGETGTGKGIAAAAIHQESERSTKPFLAINCAELAPDVLESELFGHVTGAYTGAERERQGLFRAADGGTLFLDEIGELSVVPQAKILRVVDDGIVRPVGTTTTYEVDVRVIAATHRDLKQLVAEKLFRKDLYYRLDVLGLELPPLRERGDDILLLVHHFWKLYVGDGTALRFTDDAIQSLLTYSWPGNVRELANLMQKLAVMSGGKEITAADLYRNMPNMRSRLAGSGDADRTLAAAEARRIREEFAAQNGNQSATARILGINRETLRGKLRRLGLID